MPVERRPISVNQLCELLGLDQARFIGIEPDPCSRNGGQRDSTKWWIVLEPEDMQTTGTAPALSDNTSKRKPKKSGR
jgi:hypothetical protein